MIAEGVEIQNTDCEFGLTLLPDCSVDSVVTDPPAGIAFMGKEWDDDRGGRAQWVAWLSGVMAECLRVLKPGGHALVWALPRTSHWTATAIEDAGFEVRDVITHHFGTGFPKSLDVSKAIDRQRHDGVQVRQVTAWIAAARDAAGIGNREIDEAFGFHGMAGHWTSQGSQPAVPTLDQIPRLLEVLRVEEVPAEMRALLVDLNGVKGQPGENWFKRAVIGHRTDGAGNGSVVGLGSERSMETEFDVTAPATAAAARWAGYGTALKPASEHWILARKPLEGTVAANVLEHGVGGLNIDGCRIGTEGGTAKGSKPAGAGHGIYGAGLHGACEIVSLNAGRWPANVILSGDAAEEMDRQSGDNCGGTGGPVRSHHASIGYKGDGSGSERVLRHDSGGASRFFYCPKASKADRGEGNDHPTVKAHELMRWLVRLVTPAGGTVLDPFTGSGSTGVACRAEGLRFIGFEQDPHYFEIACRRVSA